MITVNPKLIPELEGCYVFGFKTKQQMGERKKLLHGSIEKQDRAISGARLLVEKMKDLPCEVAIEVGVQEGRVIFQGEINAYDQSSMDKVESILPELDRIIENFAILYSASSFSLHVSQSVEVTDVYRLQ